MENLVNEVVTERMVPTIANDVIEKAKREAAGEVEPETSRSTYRLKDTADIVGQINSKLRRNYE